MHRVQLLTAQGAFVHAGKMPPFDVLPDVILWGQRVFKLHREAAFCSEYRECFTYALVDLVEVSNEPDNGPDNAVPAQAAA